MKNNKILDILHEACKEYDDKVALVSRDKKMSYNELWENVNLLSKNIDKVMDGLNHPVGLYMKNSMEFIVGYYGLVKSGVVAMLIDYGLKKDELMAMVNNCHLGGFLIHKNDIEDFPLKNHFELKFINENYALLYSEDQNYETSFEKEKLKNITSCRFSSGTTGVPKCMMYTQENIIAATTNWKTSIGLTKKDKVANVASYTHGLPFNTALLAPLSEGCELHIYNNLMPAQIAKYIAENEISIFVAFPIVYQMMAEGNDKSDLNFEKLRLCVSSGTVLHDEIKQKFIKKYGLNIGDLFGIAETGLCIFNQTEKTNTVGKALNNIDIEIMDDDGVRQPAGQLGQIAIRSEAMCRGYYNFPFLMQEKVTKEGFYLSGDIAYKDEAGFVYIKGRKQDFIDVAGKKVDPKQIEDVLLTCNKIKDICVFGHKKTPNSIEVVCAAVVPRNKVSKKDLIDFVSEKIASYKIPQRVYFLESLPRNSSGKILRKVLAENLCSSL